MAILHQAELRPSKPELINAWAPRQPWCVGGTPLQPFGAYRFDDPDGEVGIETHLVRAADGTVLQIPLTYRGAPLAGAEEWLVGTMEHSVLGDRWIYDGCGDPVYAAALAGTVLSGGTQVEAFVDNAGSLEPQEPTVRVQGSGEAGGEVGPVGLVDVVTRDAATVVRTSVGDFTVHRVVGDAAADGTHVLTGEWLDHAPTVLVTATAHK